MQQLKSNAELNWGKDTRPQMVNGLSPKRCEAKIPKDLLEEKLASTPALGRHRSFNQTVADAISDWFLSGTPSYLFLPRDDEELVSVRLLLPEPYVDGILDYCEKSGMSADVLITSLLRRQVKARTPEDFADRLPLRALASFK